MAPVVADAEAGFGGALNAFELMKALIESGAAGVHFEDQLASEKKCGHLGGKVLVPTSQFVRTLDRRAPGRRRPGRADGARGADRRRVRDAAHERRRRGRPSVHRGRADGRGVLPDPGRRRGRDRPRARVRAVRRRAVVRDVHTRPRGCPGVRRGDPRAVPRQAARLQLLAELQLARAPGRRRDRAASSASSGRWATASSSSRSPGSTR